MQLSKNSIDTLLDLVEIKLSCFEVWDRDDRRELKALQTCRNELLAAHAAAGSPGARNTVVTFEPSRRRETALAS